MFFNLVSITKSAYICIVILKTIRMWAVFIFYFIFVNQCVNVLSK